jgi:hypothetical protein
MEVPSLIAVSHFEGLANKREHNYLEVANNSHKYFKGIQ